VRRIREAGRLVVGIDQNSYLWGYRTPDGSLAGFDIDLVRAIATDLLGPDPEIVYRAIPTGQRIDALRERDVDLVVRTMSITCRRLAEIAFSTAYFETGQQLVVPGDSPIRAYDDTLAGRRVCSADGSTARTWLEHDPRGAELVPAANHLDCLVLLQLGEVDALMTDGALAAGHLAQDPSLRLAGEPLTTESYGVAVNIADTDLVRWVNAVLDDYRAGGTGSDWRRAYDAWLAPYLTTRTDDDASPAAPAPPQPLYRD
jgi:polar amino acid transport system substrate-binding protein